MPKGVYVRKPRVPKDPDALPADEAATPDLPPAPQNGGQAAGKSKAKATKASCQNFLRAGYLLAKGARGYDRMPPEEDLAAQADQLLVTISEIPVVGWIVRLAAPLVLVGMVWHTVAKLEEALRAKLERKQEAA